MVSCPCWSISGSSGIPSAHFPFQWIRCYYRSRTQTTDDHLNLVLCQMSSTYARLASPLHKKECSNREASFPARTDKKTARNGASGDLPRDGGVEDCQSTDKSPNSLDSHSFVTPVEDSPHYGRHRRSSRRLRVQTRCMTRRSVTPVCWCEACGLLWRSVRHTR